MNPFTLLIKPMIAAGLFVTKLFVAVGYVATQGHDPAAQQNAAVEQVRVAVIPSETGLQSMEVEMPNGELFQLRGASPPDGAADDRPSGGGSKRPYFTRARSDADADVVATLDSTLGRTMRCEVSLPHDDAEHGSARCKLPTGERYDLVF